MDIPIEFVHAFFKHSMGTDKPHNSWMSALALAAALALTGCPDSGIVNTEGREKGTPSSPVPKVITEKNISTEWETIDRDVRMEKQFVILDLSSCTADGNTITGDERPSGNAMNIIRDNPYIKGIILPSSLTRIGSFAFFACVSLTSIIIPAGVTNIDSRAFYGCTTLPSITLPEGVTTIGVWAFGYCYSLTEITIPASVINIENSGFASSENLVRVTFEGHTTALANGAFTGNLREQYAAHREGTYVLQAERTWGKE